MLKSLYLGLDPGTTNLGWCLVDEPSLLPVASGVCSIVWPKDVLGHDAGLVQGSCQAVEEMMEKSTDVVVEQQMRREFYVQTGALIGYAVAKGKNVSSVHPRSVKRAVGIPAGGSYENNKKLAQDKCDELLGKGTLSTSHAADAYLCARYVILKRRAAKLSYVSILKPTIPHRARRSRSGGVLPDQGSKLRVPCTEGENQSAGP